MEWKEAVIKILLDLNCKRNTQSMADRLSIKAIRSDASSINKTCPLTSAISLSKIVWLCVLYSCTIWAFSITPINSNEVLSHTEPQKLHITQSPSSSRVRQIRITYTGPRYCEPSILFSLPGPRALCCRILIFGRTGRFAGLSFLLLFQGRSFSCRLCRNERKEGRGSMLLELYGVPSLRHMCSCVWVGVVPSDWRHAFVDSCHQTFWCFANVVAASFLTTEAVHHAWFLSILQRILWLH